MSALPRLYLITDRKAAGERGILEDVEAALKAGVRLIQLREKDLSTRELLALARQMRRLTAEYGSRLLVNGRADMAMAAGCDGVHLGGTSIPVNDARALLGEKAVIGVSCHSLKEALDAKRAGADFITMGPVFFTPSKAAYGEPLGLNMLKEVCHKVNLPVYAIGGIKKNNVVDALSSGAYGVSLISAIIGSPGPEKNAKGLLEEIEKYVL